MMKKQARGHSRQLVREARARKAEKRRRQRQSRQRARVRLAGPLSRGAAVERMTLARADAERAKMLLSNREQDLGKEKTNRQMLEDRIDTMINQRYGMEQQLRGAKILIWVFASTSVALLAATAYLLVR